MAVVAFDIPDPAPSTIDPSGWVQAEPFRAHLRHLMASTGMPWRALARLAGSSPTEVQRLLRGRDGRPVRRISPQLARRLYGLTEQTVAAARQTVVTADAAVDGLAELIAAGWTVTELSSRLRLSGSLMRALLEGRRSVCSRLVEVRVLAAVEALTGRALDDAA